MDANALYMIATIAVYLVGMILVGVFLSKKNETTADFYLGGRKMGPFVTAMSAARSGLSSALTRSA